MILQIERLGEIGGWEGGKFVFYLENLKKDNSQIFKFSGKEEDLENVIQKSKELRKKIVDNFIQHEKERSQSNQDNQSIQPLSLKSQNQPSSKNNYPWGIIISMGAVIAALSGVIFFLLIKNKNKKRVK